MGEQYDPDRVEIRIIAGWLYIYSATASAPMVSPEQRELVRGKLTGYAASSPALLEGAFQDHLRRLKEADARFGRELTKEAELERERQLRTRFRFLGL